MTDLSTSDFAAAMAQSDRRAYLEQRIFVLSPVGTFATALALFAVLLALFFLAAWSENVRLIGDGFRIESILRSGFTLSLMLCTALFIQRHTRLKERTDHAAFAAVLRPGAISRRSLTELTPTNARLGLFTVLGVLLGAGLSWPLFGAQMFRMAHPPYATFAWFFTVNVLLFTAFTRGVELSRTGSRAVSDAIDNDLVVDLLRIDALSVWGRSAARFALIWFTVSAVSCLFFVDAGLNVQTLTMIAVFLALGVYVFVRPMEKVHRRIRETKAAELERIRAEIDAVRAQAGRDAGAAARLQGLLAYEARIAAAPEWPFDQSTLVRVAASALILTVPWFGQAIAGYVIEHMAR